jgi:hypothetical protein
MAGSYGTASGAATIGVNRGSSIQQRQLGELLLGLGNVEKADEILHTVAFAQ